MKKKNATPGKESRIQNNQTDDTSTASQRARILKALEEVGPQGMSTISLREGLDIMHPGGRVLELRKMGRRIETIWTATINAQGCKHRCARYVLMPNKQDFGLGG